MAVQPSRPPRVSGSDGTKTLPVSGALLRLASDDRLVEQVRAGSERAFEVAYDRHHRGILAFCRHMLGSVEAAEDAVQHTFMAAFGDLERSTKAIQLRPWLYTIARNRCLSVLRARREYPVAEVEPPATENLSAEVERRQDLRDLLGDVAGLPEEQRAALVLAELGAVSHEEIAAVLGVPREKVKALVFQARTSLTASRRARETPCTEIREQLANLRGGALRRSPLRRHLRECAGCREFHGEVKAQRRDLAVILPVVPTLALKDAVLGAVFGSGAAGGGGAIAAAGGGAFAAKALVAVALVGGGTVAGVQATREAARPDRATAGPPVGVRLAAPALGVERVAEQPAGALGRRERAQDDHGNRRRAERRRGRRVPAGAQPAQEQRAREDTAHRKGPRDERGSDKHAGKQLGSEKHAGEKRAGEGHEDRPSKQRSRDKRAAPPVAAPTPEPAAKDKGKDAPAATGEGEADDEDEDEDDSE
jgi:RNA polymerase sigma factor (sigma-70 family)